MAERRRRPRNRFEGNCLNYGRNGHRAEEYRSAKKKIEKSRDDAADKNGGDRGKCYICGSEENFAHKHGGLCRSLKHRTRDCEERGAEKDAMLAKMNGPAKYEVGLMAVTIGAAYGDGKEERDLDSGASFKMSHKPE